MNFCLFVCAVLLFLLGFCLFVCLLFLLHPSVSKVRALVVVPSQELSSQVVSVFELMVRGTGLSVARVSGQSSLESECAMLHQSGSYPPGSKVDILVATPGRLVDHLDR